MPRRAKRDAATSTAAVAAMLNAAKGAIVCPAHVRLREGDQPFWDGVVCARARDEWTEADLVVAAQLARCQADIERESITLDAEGTVATNERGTMVCNPRVSVLEQLARREMALMRTLRMGGAHTADPRHLMGQRKIERQSGELRKELEADDELLAA